MKRITLLKTLIVALFLIIGVGNAWGQATLPLTRTIWNSTPTGWTDSGTGSYTSSFACTGDNSGKMDGSGDYYIVNFNSTPDELVFKLKSASMSGESYVVVDESSNGSSWSSIGTYGTCGACTSITDCDDITLSLDGATRFVRWTYTKSSGNLVVDDVSISAGASGPTITTSISTLTGFTYLVGSGPSAEQSFTVEGSNLTADITITPPTNYEISTGTGGSFVATNPITLTQSGGSVSSTTIYVRLKAGLSAGTYNGEDITCSSTGATDKTVTCDGEVTSPEPPTSFTAAANGSDQIDLSWTKNSNGNNVLIVYDLDGSFTDPVDGNTYTVSSSALGGTVIYNGSETSFNHTSLITNTQYFYKAWSVDGSTNYSSGVTANATTEVDNDADVTNLEQPAATDISSLADESGDAVAVFKFDITDWGTSDGLPTKVTNIRIYPGAANTADWTNTIQGIALAGNSLGAITTGSPAISDTEIDIPISVGNLNVSDTDNEEITLSVYLNTSGITENEVLSFQIDADNHGFTSDATGTGFVSEFNSGTDIVSNNFTIDVEATKLSFIQQPSNVNVDEVMSPAVTAAFTDANGNIDVDYDGAGFEITLSTTGTFSGSATTEVAPVNGVATFSNIILSAAGTGVTITATDENDWVTSPSIQSNTFNVTDLPKLIISEVADPSDIANAKFVELYNSGEQLIDFSVTTIYIARQANGGSWASAQLSGTISPKETFVISYSTATFNSSYGFDSDQNEGAVITGNGNDGYYLYYDGDHTSGTVLDAFGVIDQDGTGEPWEYADSRAVRNSDILTPNTTWTASEWTITSANVADMTPGEHNGYIYFVGTTDWNTAANWSNNKVPTSTNNVIIPAAKAAVEIASDATADCNNLTVDGTLTIKSNASGTGSLIINGTVSGSGTITSERYMSGSETWRLVSSPVTNQVISDVNNWTPTGSYTGGHGYDFYAYQESTATWLNQKVGANNITNFAPGQGYLVSFEAADQTKTYTGTFNNGDVTVSVSKTGTGDYAGANLIGNPYPSGIDWNDADRSLFSDNFAYVYDRVSNVGETYEGYVQVNGSAADAFIAPHQGFFVIKDAAGSSDFTFTNAMPAHGGTFTKAPTSFSSLKLKVSNGSYYDIATINIKETASFDRDRMDAIKFYSNNANMPNFFTISEDNKKLAINTIPAINIEVPIVMGVTIPANGAYEISINDQGDDFTDEVLLLEDLFTGVRHNLSDDGSYSFSASTSDNPNRFLLHFGVVGLDENDTESSLKAYLYNNTLYVQNSLEAANIRILDLQGRLLLEQQLNGHGLQSLPLDFPAGVYVVQLVNSKAQKSVKVIVE